MFKMWIYILLSIFLTLFNIGLWYKETIVNYFMIVKLFNGNWTLVTGLYLLSLKLRFKQWWGKSCTQVDVDTFVLHHHIQGKEVKIIVKLETISPLTTVINNHGKDITLKVIPYLRWSAVGLKPKYINEKGLTICR